MPRAERVLVVGAGGHGRVVADLARALGMTVVGYADAAMDLVGRTMDAAGARVLLSQEELLALVVAGDVGRTGADAVLIGIGDNAVRARLCDAFGGLEMPTLVHPTAWVSPSAVIGRGSVLLPRSVLHTAASVGDVCIVNSGAIVEHDCRLDDAVHVSPGAILCGGVVVGARSAIGAGSVIIPELTVGSDAVVGAGAVVVRSVASNVTVVGNPARPIRRPIA